MSTAPAPMPGQEALRDKLVGQQLGRYEVLYRLASGGMGSVYVARSRSLGGFERLVAIKLLHPHLAHEDDFITMFLDEARLAANIRHPNVVATLDVCQTPEGYFLVMEYIEGDHLGALLSKAVQFGVEIPAPVTLRIILDALGGLASAHRLTHRGEALNLVHRDVSPQNILVGVDGVARLTDFGVAKAEQRLSSTRDGQFKGKLAYTAPEQVELREVNQASDLFAMGVVLWEALTGRRLFRGENNTAVLRKLLMDPIPAPSSVKASLAPLDAVLAKSLSRAPEERYESAQHMADALEEAAAGVGGVASPRAVAELVKRLAEEKLAREHKGVQIALEHVKGNSRPPPGDGSDPGASKTPRVGEDVDTIAARITTGSGAAARPRSRRGTAVAIAIVAVAVAIAAALALGGGQEPAAEDAPPTEEMARPALEPPPETGSGTAAVEPSEPERSAGGTDVANIAPPEPTGTEGADGTAEAGGDRAAEQGSTAGADRRRTKRRRFVRGSGQTSGSGGSQSGGQTGSGSGEGGGTQTDVLSNPYRQQ